MKKRILLFSSVAGMLFLSLSSYLTGPANYGYDCTGAEAAGTGTHANPTGCSATGGTCHSTAATPGITLNIQLDSAGVPVTHYIGGNSYTVKIAGTNGSSTTFPYAGFQLTSIVGSTPVAVVTNAGAWASTGLPVNTEVRAPYSPYTYLNVVEHTNTLTVTNDTFSRSFAWTAPVVGTGTISFWGGVNFVNGSTNTSGSPSIQQDLWNTAHVVITEIKKNNAVGSVKNSSRISAFPNPATDALTLQFDGSASGKYTIKAFDLAGKCVAQENAEVTGASQSVSINTSNWEPGIYFLTLEDEATRQVIQVVKR